MTASVLRTRSHLGLSSGLIRPTCEERTCILPLWKWPPREREIGFAPYHEATTTVPSVATASTAACSPAPEELASIATSAPLPPVAARPRRSSPGSKASSAPTASASSLRFFKGSTARTRSAPASLSSCVTRRPTTPCPKTSRSEEHTSELQSRQYLV